LRHPPPVMRQYQSSIFLWKAPFFSPRFDSIVHFCVLGPFGSLFITSLAHSMTAMEPRPLLLHLVLLQEIPLLIILSTPPTKNRLLCEESTPFPFSTQCLRQQKPPPTIGARSVPPGNTGFLANFFIRPSQQGDLRPFSRGGVGVFSPPFRSWVFRCNLQFVSNLFVFPKHLVLLPAPFFL